MSSRADGADKHLSKSALRNAAAAAFVCGSLLSCGALLGFQDIDFTMVDASNGDASDADAQVGSEASLVDGGDASGSVDASDGAADGALRCTRIVFDGGFEGMVDCTPWANYGGPLETTTVAHSGTTACRACAGIGYSVNVDVDLGGFEAGTKIHAEAWVRAENALIGRDAAVMVFGTQEGTTRDYVLTDTYQKVESTHLLRLLGGEFQTVRFRMTIYDVDGGPDGGDACLLFDDIMACVVDEGG